MSLKAFVTGGAGFIGSNLAARIQDRGGIPVVFDDLSRPGSETNLEWLRGRGGLTFIRGDVRNPVAVSEALRRHRDSGAIFHLAAQVAVTTSVADPRHDFEVNALGTFNVLEAARAHAPRTPFIFASTNKVYGSLEDLAIEDAWKRYVLRDRPGGIAEDRPLDFHSPYGCSKGAADQYVVDYGRIFGIPAVAFRQSCIYGRRQMGVEDQGWVAWFLIAAMSGKPITIYGDGKQVRDILFCDDLVDLYIAAVDRIAAARGRAYNVGGGPANTLSLLELLDAMADLGLRPEVRFAPMRPGDQRVFVADTGAALRDFGWAPKVDVRAGIAELARWIEENLPVLQGAVA